MTQTNAVSCNQFVAHPPEEVWRALSWAVCGGEALPPGP